MECFAKFSSSVSNFSSRSKCLLSPFPRDTTRQSQTAVPNSSSFYNESLSPFGGVCIIESAPKRRHFVQRALGEFANGIIPQQPILHCVKQGETLWDIAREYNTTIEKIMEANGLRDGNCIAAASKLVIPPQRIHGLSWKLPHQRWLSSDEENDQTPEKPLKTPRVVQKEEAESAESTANESTPPKLHSDPLHESIKAEENIIASSGEMPKADWQIGVLGNRKIVIAGGFLLFSLALGGAVYLKGILSDYQKEKLRAQQLAEAEAARRINATKQRFTKALQIDRVFRKESSSGSNSEGSELPESKKPKDEASIPPARQLQIAMAESPSELEAEFDPEQAKVAMRKEYESIRSGFDTEAYEKFLRESGSLQRGRFRGGLPRKYKE